MSTGQGAPARYQATTIATALRWLRAPRARGLQSYRSWPLAGSPGRDYRGVVAKADDTITITGAQVSLKDDQRDRTRRYLMSMALRTVCFVGAVVASGWLRWALVAGAVVLPYVAVVAANAGRRKAPVAAPAVILTDQRHISAGNQ